MGEFADALREGMDNAKHVNWHVKRAEESGDISDPMARQQLVELIIDQVMASPRYVVDWRENGKPRRSKS